MPPPANSKEKLTDSVIEDAMILWKYHHMNHELKQSDCILTLGSHDLRVAERAAELYHQGWASLLVFSGGLGNFTQDLWTESEADKFAAIAIGLGVPENAILIENRSTNTGENIQFTEKLLQSKGIFPDHYIVVQKPYMERRSYATFKKHWPEKNVVITSPQISFEDYPIPEIPLDWMIHIMVGDLQRIKVYPSLGFQIYQEIPVNVWEAYERLVDAGFDGHLIKDVRS
jgi:uncharacterized SAM-binding protein YcdF (DUF218 family)